ncbi:MAG: indole-3-glycerol-phosphate synthase [Ferrovum sp. 37-45-19]|jgi:indole-3-glycerol phosphate synthase|uniref:indole-3-glycerol phosphate synthase TrpC n=1 Tax=Ferrovum sp. JA12 TaxID=1356299 RepID=UPI000703BA79|nr:indole-3-glycerol phosphate synthase TrpC [Ferrovum sp. JA12]OYV78566.1 MAG: indole-3-glycerol-phosphate synthase [Ferrovum sp. 21-44-67]OYV93068.1 MAG: indole-3-glycerol-phosphate synthase [Ferrovum sp. 37-45-19]OZB32914.1 MAG: indole-3-glycerol-phosphate synthase [Ferrovum sp. 34-44-207]HQT82443.1 indole-3-glycerol phosphate synthase TrpC [Ferrovaceae bacterium]KRH79636.1 indole-3-glycerol phosphate synthase [Ferrovum sp. JA12]
MDDILKRIVETKLEEVAAAKEQVSLEVMREMAMSSGLCRDFVGSMERKLTTQQAAIIAEIKRASPSKGVLRHDFDPAAIAQSYEENGAACLSVLTDEEYFQGSIEYLREARYASTLPILRKDFIIDEYQIYESKAIGADAILLIVSILEDDLMHTLCQLAQSLGLAVLVESHDEIELKRALRVPTQLMGINNRNLKTFETSLNVTLNLQKHIPQERIIITESGILTREDVNMMRSQGVNSFLIGEAFMKAIEPGIALRQLFRLN